MRWTWVALVSVVLVAGCTSERPPTVRPGPTVALPVPGPVAAGSAVEVAPLAMPRAAHTATPLRDGRVLVVGGCTRPGCGGTPDGGRAELYEPETRRFVPGPAMVRARAGHTATALADGRVLIVGGYPDEGRPPLREAEIYDPGTGAFRQTGALATARGAHTATPLRDGRVLVVGGVDGRDALSTVELYNPASGRFTAAASLPGPRAIHGAVLLRDGRVLVAGGQAGTGHGTALVDTAAVYDPAANTWTDTGRLATPKYKLALAPLPGGGALVVGGQTADGPGARLATTELFDAASGRFTPGPAMAESRYKISDAVVALRDGRVVVSGGRGAEIYAAGRLSRISGTPDVERQSPAAAALADGTVLVTGGYDDRILVTATAFLINPG